MARPSSKLVRGLRGSLGKSNATELNNILNDSGADGSWAGVSIVASGNATIGGTLDVSGSISGAAIAGTSMGAPTVSWTEGGGVAFILENDETAASLTLTGGSNVHAVGVTASSVDEVIESATGQYAKALTPNLADAYSLTDGTNDLLVYITTTDAIGINVRSALVSTPPANQTLTNSATITLPISVNKIVDNGGAVTDIILAAGLHDGQIVNIINEAGATVTFATAATSNVADGTSAVIAANRAISLIWGAGTSRWYRTG